MTITWYPAKPDAPVLDTPSVIASLDNWVQERELGVYAGYKVGEVPGAPRTYNGEGIKPAADGTHRCGTEDEWANGAIFNPNAVFPRRADGLPTCCGELPAGVVVGGPVIADFGPALAAVDGYTALVGMDVDYASSGAYNPATTGYLAYFSNFGGYASAHFKLGGLVVGRTYHFRFWVPDTAWTVTIGGGTSPFGGSTWGVTLGPGSHFYEWTQTIPVGTLVNQGLVTDPTFTTGPRMYGSVIDET